ncbi:MAG TPA: S9 family peptidase [Anaerolineales bacterium]|nr:S9 family peptidase [Anaerolineales bacterium]
MTIPFSQYLNIRYAVGPSFSPDGRRVAFLTDITGVPQAWTVNIEGGWPDQITFHTERVSQVHFSPAVDQLVFSRDLGGNENAQLYLVNGDGLGERKLTHADEVMHLFGNWSQDGKQIAFTANQRDRSKFDVYVQNVETGEIKLAWENEYSGFLYVVGFSPDASRLLIYMMYNSLNNDLFEIDLQQKVIRKLTEHEGNIRYLSPTYSADGKSVYCACDHNRDLATLTRIDLNDLQHHFIQETKNEIEYVAASPDGHWLLWNSNVEGAHQFHLLDLQTNEVRQPHQLPLGVISDFAAPIFSSDSQRIAFGFTMPTRTSDIWVWDIQTNEVSPVTRSSHAGIPTSSFRAPQLIRYPTFDGLSIPAWFYPPAETSIEKYPVIIDVHGGPEGQAQPIFDHFVQYFISRGYGVLLPNVRGSSGYGKHYLSLDNVEKRMNSVADLAYLVKWLETRPDVDTKRIAITGGSYGGFMVLSALTTYPDLWAAAVDIVGISNFVTFLENTSAYRRSHREGEYGSLERDREFLTSISPIHHVDKIVAPLIVIHGANDPRVPLSEAEQLVSALRARDVPVEFLVYDDEGHGLVKLKNILDAYPKMANFLDKHLGWSSA